MRIVLAFFALVAFIFVQPSYAAKPSAGACVSMCAEVVQHGIGYEIKVRAHDGSIIFSSFKQFEATVPREIVTTPQVVPLAADVDLSKTPGTSTSVTVTPLAGGGSVIIITTRVGGVVVSVTVIVVNASGQVVETVPNVN